MSVGVLCILSVSHGGLRIATFQRPGFGLQDEGTHESPGRPSGGQSGALHRTLSEPALHNLGDSRAGHVVGPLTHERAPPVEYRAALVGSLDCRTDRVS